MKKNIKWIVCLLSMTIFILLAILVLKGEDIKIDLNVYNFISKYINSNLTIFIKIFTYIGSASTVIGIFILTLILCKNKKYSLYMAINLITITLFQFILKNIFLRSRPIDINLIDEKGYSFPSGHSLTAMAFYGFIIYLIYKSSKNKKTKILYIISLSTLIILIGLSRIYLGVHFFTDVLGGFTFSLSYLIIYTNLIKNKLENN